MKFHVKMKVQAIVIKPLRKTLFLAEEIGHQSMRKSSYAAKKYRALSLIRPWVIEQTKQDEFCKRFFRSIYEILLSNSNFLFF